MTKPMPSTWGLLPAAFALGALALTGCSGDDPDSDNDASSPPTSASAPSSPSTPATPSASTDDGQTSGSGTDLATATFAISWQDAVGKAQAAFDGQLSEVGMDSERPTAAYKVELVSSTEEYTVYVDAATGALQRPETEKLDSDDRAEKQDEVVDPAAVVPWDQALAAAQAEQSGPVVEWKLEGTSRGPHYQFDIGTGSDDREVNVDATTGKVTR